MPTGTRQLNVSVTPHFSKMIRNKVKSGRYANASEVVREALRRMEQDDLLGEGVEVVDPDDWEAQVQKGMDSIAGGDYIELKGDKELHEFFQDVIARGRERLKKRQRAAGR